MCNFCIVMEAGVMDLQSSLNNKRGKDGVLKPLSSVDFKFIAFNLATCLLHLHLRHWVHGDIKLRNVIKREDDSYQLIDFDTARAFGEPMSASVTPRYCPPEKAKILRTYVTAKEEDRRAAVPAGSLGASVIRHIFVGRRTV